MAEITVDHDVPINPLPHRGRGAVPTYPFRDLEVGDSFLSPTGYNRTRQAVYNVNERGAHGNKDKSRRFEMGVDPDDPGKFRVWRVA